MPIFSRELRLTPGRPNSKTVDSGRPAAGHSSQVAMVSAAVATGMVAGVTLKLASSAEPAASVSAPPTVLRRSLE